MYRHRAPRPN